MSVRAFSAMAEASSQILEGVFAIKKPPSLSSAQVLRDLQNKFKESRTFQPLLQQTERREYESGQGRNKRRRISSDNVFKMGHGGTLDPLATGVLIVGIGRGTKYLANFLECTKTYDTIVLFGKSTDTYDIAGKVVADAPAKHITEATVEAKLDAFRGDIKQVPPIYSALKINGVKAYEYARSGKELPRELETRDMKVEECRLLEWFQAGQHNYRWPAAEAADEDREAARKLMKGAARTEGVSGLRTPKTRTRSDDAPSQTTDDTQTITNDDSQATVKANTQVMAEDNSPATVDATTQVRAEIDLETKTNNDLQVRTEATSELMSKEDLNSMAASNKAALHTHDIPALCETPADAPAARVQLTVSSGFYVRSFAHDLGLACGSFGIMTELARTRQAEYTSIEPAPPDLIPCMTYEELEKSEDIWGPKIIKILEKWMHRNPVPSQDAVNDRDRPKQHWGQKGRGNLNHTSSGQRFGKQRWDDRDGQRDRRRNSSSPE